MTNKAPQLHTISTNVTAYICPVKTIIIKAIVVLYGIITGIISKH